MQEAKNAISSIQLSEYEPPLRVEEENRNGKWVDLGHDNLYPDYILDLYKNSTTNHAVIDKMTQMILGNGIDSNVANGSEILRGLGLNNILPMVVFDYYCQGGSYIEVIRSKGGDELKLINMPFENCRIGYRDEKDEELNGVWYSGDWANYRKDRYKPEFVPFYDPQKNDARSVVVIYRPTPGSKYYPSPTYQGALDYIEAEIQIGRYHNNQLLNGLFPSFLVSFNNGKPSKDHRDQIVRDMETKLGGAKNAGKFLALFNDPGNDNKTEFEPFPISDAAEQYQFLSELATLMILRGHRVTNPVLFGVREGGGLGNNANEMQEARRIMEEDVIFPDRRAILQALSPLLMSKGVVPDWDMMRDEADTDSDLSYDTGQIKEVREILSDYNLGTLTGEQARNLVISLLGFDEESALLLFPDKTELSKQDDRPALSDELGEALLNGLKEYGQTIDDLESDGWEAILIEDAGSHDDEEGLSLDYILDKFKEGTELTNPRVYAHPGERSEFGDSGLYKLRYRYSQNLSENTRGFCRHMVGLSKTGLIFRKEDIDKMSKNPKINGQFAKKGESWYDMFLYKGGALCHHKWERVIFFRKRDENGRFLPPSPESAKTEKGMENDKRVGNVPYVPQKGKEATPTNDMPNGGFVTRRKRT